MTITAAADGSALGNPGPAGWAWYVDERRWAAGGWPHGTNNQGELMAVLDLLNATAGDADQDLHILCDSQYVINAVTKWMPGWKRKGWRKADGSPVLNLDLLKKLDAALEGRTYRFEWVKGHAGHELNEAADDRARAVATAYQQGKPIPTGPGWDGTPSRASSSSAAADQREHTLFDEPGFAELDIFETDEEIVEKLERHLLEPSTRADSAELASLLHPDFVEIGTSGRVWDREAVLESLSTESAAIDRPSDFSATRLAPDVILLTFRLDSANGSSLRSSTWVRTGGNWRIRFHQGTLEG